MNGVINLLKPPGISSNGAVVYLRGLLGGQKVGHAGTLDPGACGVLPICVGKATKISSYIMGGSKEYVAEITFGAKTDTGDSYGRITEENKKVLPDSDKLKQVLYDFIGQQSQLTPAYSAVKFQGRNLYELARKGLETPQKYREINILEAEYVSQTNEASHLLRIKCGKGTYIRTLCEDIGKALGTVAYMSFLARTECAGLNIEDSYTPDELAEPGMLEKALLPMDRFLQSYESVPVDEKQKFVLINGGIIEHDGIDSNTVRVYAGIEFLGLACNNGNKLKMNVLLI